MKKKHILTISFLRQFVWALRQSRVVLIAAGVWAAEEGTRQDNRYQNKNLKSISVRLSWVHFDRSAVKFGVAGEKTRDQFDGQTDSLGVKGEWHWNSFPWRQWASLTIPSCISVLRCLDWVQRRRNNLLMTLLRWHQSLSVSFSNGQNPATRARRKSEIFIWRKCHNSGRWKSKRSETARITLGYINRKVFPKSAKMWTR